MGFRFRKSINLGGGFRINMSKSGIGYSWGTKGARFSRTASGKRRTTLSVPGTGISYVSETGGKRKKRAASARTSASRNANTNTYGGTDMGWGKFFLCFFLGIFGVHKFVEHKTGMGILYLFTGGLLGFGWLYDCAKYLFAALNTPNVPNNMYGSVPPAPPYSAPPYAAPTEVSGGQESGVYTWTPPAPGYPAAPPMMPPAAPTGSNWKKAVKSVLLWALTALFGLLALAFLFGGGVLAGLFALLFVAVVIPISSWQNIVKRFLRGPLKVILAVVLAILFFVAVPPAEVSETEPAEPSPTVSAEEIPAAVGAFSSPTPTVKPTPKPSTAPSATPSPTPTPTPEPTPAATPEPTPEPTEVPVAESAPEPTAEPTPQPTPQPTPEPTPESTPEPTEEVISYQYILNTNTMRFHKPTCGSADTISPENREDYYGPREDLILAGYNPCGNCHP